MNEYLENVRNHAYPKSETLNRFIYYASFVKKKEGIYYSVNSQEKGYTK